MLPTNITLTFEQYNTAFGNQQLAIYKAKHLINNFRAKHSKEQIEEIERELKNSLWMAQILFDKMLAIGIPENLLSYHLQPEL